MSDVVQLSLKQFPKTDLLCENNVFNKESFVERNIKEEFFDGVWRISFVNSYYVIVDLDLDNLFLNGKRFLTTSKEKVYDELFVVRKNRVQQKTRVKTLFAHGQVLAVDVGWDGRVFFKYWKTERDYNIFRKAPDWVASYHNDRISKKKFVWVQDLHEPKYVKLIKGVSKK